MKKNISNSNKIYKRALELIPSGGQTYSKGVTQFSEGVAPKYLKKGDVMKLGIDGLGEQSQTVINWKK